MTDTRIQARKQIPARKPRGQMRRRLAGLLGGLVLLGLIWMILAPVLTPAYTGATLSVSQAHEQAVAGEILLIDIRRPDEWRRTGIGEGAVPLDMRRKDFTEALGALVRGGLDKPIALICARGVRSARLSQRLLDAGFTRIIDVPEGMTGSRAGPGWLAANLPTRKYREASK